MTFLRDDRCCNTSEDSISRRRIDYPLLPVLLVAILAASCGDGTGTGTGTGEEPNIGSASGIRKIGRVSARQFIGENEDGSEFIETSITANFLQYDRELSNDELTEISGEFDTSTESACVKSFIATDGSTIDMPGEERSTIPESHLISAGELLPITTPVGSWQELDSSRPGFSQYSSVVNSPLPSGALLHIPGEEFPAVQSVAVRSLERVDDLDITQLESGRVMPDSVVSWQPSDDGNNVMNFNFTIVSSSTEQQDETHGYSVSVRCMSEDIGTFSFPADIQNTLREEILLSEDISIFRSAPRITRQIGDAVLWIDSFTPYRERLLQD